MATIRKKGDFQWHVQIRRKGFPNQTRTFESRDDAAKWARMIESEMDRGVFVSRKEAESTTLAEALGRYLKEVTPLKKGAKREEQRISQWLKDPLATRTLAAIRGADLAEYRDKLRNDGKADATIRLNLMLISHLFETARKEWGMEGLANPCRSITMPCGSRQRDRRFEAGEEERFFEALDQHCRNPYIPALIRFAIETAARRSELVKLQWENVDKKKQTAKIIDGKNGEDRTIPLSSRAVEILESLPRHLSGRVFPVGSDATSRAVSSAVKKARKAYESECLAVGKKPLAGFLKDFRLHDTRHEATSRFFEKGLNQMEAAAVTGHKTLQMLKRYTHLKAEDLARKLG
ncbi:MAG: tyrosine-type recombinase/integrase [Burkholderiales bacterium]